MNEIEKASRESPADIGCGNEMATHLDTLGDAADGEFRGGQPKVMDFNVVSQSFGLLKGAGVGGAAERAFETEGSIGFEATVDFMKEQLTCFDGNRLEIKGRQAAGEFIRVKKPRDGIELAEVGAGKGGFARAVASGEKIESR